MAVSIVSTEENDLASKGAVPVETFKELREKSCISFSRRNGDDCKERTNRWADLVRFEADGHTLWA